MSLAALLLAACFAAEPGGVVREAESPSMETLEDATKAFKSPEAKIRIAALERILKLDPKLKRSKKTVLGALRDPDVDVQGRAAELLIPLGPAARFAVPDLLPLLEDRDDGEPSITACNAYKALEAIGTPQALAAAERWWRQGYCFIFSVPKTPSP